MSVQGPDDKPQLMLLKLDNKWLTTISYKQNTVDRYNIGIFFVCLILFPIQFKYLPKYNTYLFFHVNIVKL